jgi:hypothetical protein
MNWFIIIFCIIAISLFLLTKYHLLEKKTKIEKIETFKTNELLSPSEKLFQHHNIKLVFLTPNEAKDLININDTYIQNMNQPNLHARNCETINELYNKYLNAFDTITPEEETKVIKFIYNILNETKNTNPSYYRYLVYWLNKISFAKAKHWLEAGMPHTHKQTLVMDAGWFDVPRKTTLVHELAHVHQRAHPFDFEDIYEKLGYIYHPENVNGLEATYSLNRNNPDGLSNKWIWYNNKDNTYWWIGVVFKNAVPETLGDINDIAVKLEKSADGEFYYLKQQPVKLSNFKDFNNYFGDNPNNYQPNEMSSKYSEWFLEDVLRDEKSKKYYEYPGYLKYKKFFQNIMDKYY